MANLCLLEGKRSLLILEDGKKVEVETIEHHIDGGATHVAVGLARLGNRVSILCKVGTNQEGALIIQSFQGYVLKIAKQINQDVLVDLI